MTRTEMRELTFELLYSLEVQKMEQEEYNEQIELFLEFAKEEDQILSILDKADNIVLDEIILFCFESSIISFFEKVI